MAAAPRARMLRLLSLLQTGRRWSADELIAAMHTTGRTLRRDIEHLRGLGYPVESVRGPGGHYRLVAGAALPPLMLEDDEAIATVLGLQLVAAGSAGVDTTEPAERAAAKLRRILPAPLRRRTDELLTAVEIGRTDQPLPEPGLLGALATPITARRVITFTYAGTSSTAQRTVEPVRLVALRQRWYVFAWDVDRDDWRSFRLDRMRELRITSDAFHPRPLPADDLAHHLEQRFGAALRVVLTLHADAGHAATRLHRIDGTLDPLDGNRCRYVAEVDSYEWLATVLVLADIEFAVDEPDDFAAYLTRAAQRLLRGAGHPAGASDP